MWDLLNALLALIISFARFCVFLRTAESHSTFALAFYEASIVTVCSVIYILLTGRAFLTVSLSPICGLMPSTVCCLHLIDMLR